MINLEKPCEGIHYALNIMEDVDNDQAWQIELLEGKYTGTTVTYGQVKFDGVNNKLAFKLAIRETPIEDLSVDDPEFRDYAGVILEDLIKTNLANGNLVYGENENN